MDFRPIKGLKGWHIVVIAILATVGAVAIITFGIIAIFN